ncbi:hypothetical protein [Rubripirellula lacrimiformis]|uniref:hypothetical protein n=1 Tax=Rubripirellula lacrimiformis TaxID=1930273 RepID=UPI0011A85754|nr:hypothetical protein [Rubripirellula lacrimiformis]
MKSESVAGSPLADSAQSDSPEHWDAFRQKITAGAPSSAAESVFAKSAKDGAAYRWGVAVATGEGCGPLLQTLSRLACEASVPAKFAVDDLPVEAELFIEAIESTSTSDTPLACQAVVWAAALPALCSQLESDLSFRLMTALREFHDAVLTRNQPCSATHLIVAGELGLTLAWRLSDVPSCRLLQQKSLTAVNDWCDQYDQAVADAVEGAVHARMVLASLFRCGDLIQATTKQKPKKNYVKTADLLSTWIAALTTRDGGSAFSQVGGKELVDDLAGHGLLDRAIAVDPESLKPAFDAATGKTQTGGRLAWEVSLPETMWHDADAKIAVMLPEWDVRKGRTHVDYSGENVAIEMFAGRAKLISGQWQTMIEVDGEQQHACGNWSEVCEYTDDDVHYLELEQPWTGGLLLQRQLMLVREDRTLLFADAIVQDPSSGDGVSFDEDLMANQGRRIKYWGRLPIADGISPDPEPETREIFLADGKRRAMIVPLAANEWRVGPTSATLTTSEDNSLVFTAEGKGRLYCPLWMDCSQRRFKRKRTWRPLTVVDNLRVCRKDEAAGYRIQVGSEQWMVYRTLGEPKTRSILGKHLIADFFASRIDMTYGDHDALVTVDDSEPSDDDSGQE